MDKKVEHGSTEKSWMKPGGRQLTRQLLASFHTKHPYSQSCITSGFNIIQTSDLYKHFLSWSRKLIQPVRQKMLAVCIPASYGWVETLAARSVGKDHIWLDIRASVGHKHSWRYPAVYNIDWCHAYACQNATVHEHIMWTWYVAYKPR